MSRSRAALALILPLLAVGASARAADTPTDPKHACMPSARALCAPEIAAMDRQGVKLCLWKNLDKVSPDCREAINAVRAAHGQTPPPAPTH